MHVGDWGNRTPDPSLARRVLYHAELSPRGSAGNRTQVTWFQTRYANHYNTEPAAHGGRGCDFVRGGLAPMRRLWAPPTTLEFYSPHSMCITNIYWKLAAVAPVARLDLRQTKSRTHEKGNDGPTGSRTQNSDLGRTRDSRFTMGPHRVSRGSRTHLACALAPLDRASSRPLGHD